MALTSSGWRETSMMRAWGTVFLGIGALASSACSPSNGIAEPTKRPARADFGDQGDAAAAVAAPTAGSLRTAAAIHTNAGKGALISAAETSQATQQLERLAIAVAEYKAAAAGWQSCLDLAPDVADDYETRYWLADARRNYVRIQLVLHRADAGTSPEPKKADLDAALTAAIAIRDDKRDNKFLDYAAFFVVDLIDIDRDLAYLRYERTGGTSGIRRPDDVQLDSTDLARRKVVKAPVPAEVLASIRARDEYARLVPVAIDAQNRAVDHAYYAAEQFFLYGQLDEARSRFEAIVGAQCGKHDSAFISWTRLVTIARLEKNAARVAQLAEADRKRSCALTPHDHATVKQLLGK